MRVSLISDLGRFLSIFLSKSRTIAITLLTFSLLLVFFLTSQGFRDGSMIRNSIAFDQASQTDPIGSLQESQSPYKLLSSLKFTKGSISYEEIFQNLSPKKEYHNIALIRWGYEALDSEDVEKIIENIEPLSKQRNPWSFLAREILALAYLRSGSYEKFRLVLLELIDDEVSPFLLKQRIIGYLLHTQSIE